MNEAQKNLDVTKNTTIAALDQAMAAYTEAAIALSGEQREVITRMLIDGSEKNIASMCSSPELVAFARMLASHVWGQILVSIADQLN